MAVTLLTAHSQPPTAHLPQIFILLFFPPSIPSPSAPLFPFFFFFAVSATVLALHSACTVRARARSTGEELRYREATMPVRMGMRGDRDTRVRLCGVAGTFLILFLYFSLFGGSYQDQGIECIVICCKCGARLWSLLSRLVLFSTSIPWRRQSVMIHSGFDFEGLVWVCICICMMPID